MAKYELSRRCYLGPTAMDAEVALLMANQAKVGPATLVYDPFVGTGSILVAAAHFGATTVVGAAGGMGEAGSWFTLNQGMRGNSRILIFLSSGSAVPRSTQPLSRKFESFALHCPESVLVGPLPLTRGGAVVAGCRHRHPGGEGWQGAGSQRVVQLPPGACVASVAHPWLYTSVVQS